MAENLELGRSKSAAPTPGEEQVGGLIHETAFTLPPTRVQMGTPNDPGGLDPLPPVPAEPPPDHHRESADDYDSELDEMRQDADRLRAWDQNGAEQERQRRQQRPQPPKHEANAAELVEEAQRQFASGADRPAAMQKFQEAIRKADAEGTGIVQYATERLQLMPPHGERDQATEKRLEDLVEQSVNRRVDARYAFADALDQTGDHASAQAIRQDGVEIFLSMIVAQTHAQQRSESWQLYQAQKPVPRQFDI